MQAAASKPPKISYRWTDRAVRLVDTVERMDAPQEIQQAAFDAVQHFVWATDCRRQANNPACRTPGWGAKADKAHYAGKKAFAVAQAWVDEVRAAKVPA
jgi:hypothetical protein